MTRPAHGFCGRSVNKDPVPAYAASRQGINSAVIAIAAGLITGAIGIRLSTPIDK
jgi:hypothetical protein